MIQVSSLTKAFGNRVAVDGINFEVSQGEAFGLLGPNGAGKTTTLSMMVGLLPADSGTVTIDGKNPLQAETRRLIGIAPQALAIYEELTAQENMQFFGQLYGLSGTRLRDRVDWCLKFAGLDDRRQHRVKTFSGGMKRRLNMAAALIHEPKLVLFDEPTVGVDPQSRNHLLESVSDLKKNGTTVLYTTHYMEEAQRLCDRVGVMDQGKLLAIGPISQLLDKYGGSSIVEAELAHEFLEANGGLRGLTLPPEFSRVESRITVTTHNPLEAAAKMMAMGSAIQSLQIQQPSLESVFLSLTGKKLRD